MNNLGYAEYYTETVLDVCMAKINVLKKLALKAENKELRKLRKYSDIRLYLKYKTTNLADIKIYTLAHCFHIIINNFKYIFLP